MDYEENVIAAEFPKTPDVARPVPRDDISAALAVVCQWRKILNARLLALLALLGSLAVFGFVMYDPTPLRLAGSSLYAVGVLWPVMALFMRKG